MTIASHRRLDDGFGETPQILCATRRAFRSLESLEVEDVDLSIKKNDARRADKDLLESADARHLARSFPLNAAIERLKRCDHLLDALVRGKP